MTRREFIAGLGSMAAWPREACAQQTSMPVIGWLGGLSLDSDRTRNWLANSVKPVTLPPGRFRLGTIPSATGSSPMEKTIGMVAVAALSARTPTGPVAKITAARSLTRSAAMAG